MKYFLIMLNLIALSFSICIYAKNTASSISKTPAIVTVTCPPSGALKKDSKLLTWSAPGGFKSYETSFVDQVASFLGAQWVGANVGQITCIYQGEDKTTFPILLVYGTITLQPSGGKWDKGSNQSYLNCISTNPKLCPFKVRTKPQEPDIFKQLENLRSDSSIPN